MGNVEGDVVTTIDRVVRARVPAGFERYVARPGRVTGTGVTIGKSNSLSLGGGLVAALGHPPRLQYAYHTATRTLALVAAAADDPTSVKITKFRSGQTYTASVAGACRRWDIPRARHRWPNPRIEDGVVYLPLDEALR